MTKETDLEPALLEALRRIVESFDPDRVYLFGSTARGDAGPDRDYDLLTMRVPA